MSDIKQYIKMSMGIIDKQFCIENCIYEYDSMSDIHFVEVNPSSLFNEEDFQHTISELSMSMNKLFPNDCIIFSTLADNMPLSINAETLIDNASYLVSSWHDLFLGNNILPNDMTVTGGENNYALAA